VSSTTERRRERAQVIVIFAISAVVIMLVAALAFDTGTILVEKRDQQNAADGAALAGARFLPDDAAAATAAAIEIARRNGFEDGLNSADVVINIPPLSGAFTGAGNGAIEVLIGTTRSSVFAGIMGSGSWDVSSRAVAANDTITFGPFAMLALDPTACPALVVEGNGTINSNGNIQVNSSCTTGDGAFRVAGNGTLNLTAAGVGCNVNGGATEGGGVASNDCSPNTDPPTVTTGAPTVPDPYASLGDPTPIPPLPSGIVRWDPVANAPLTPAVAPPAGCPGSASPATEVAPALCNFGGSYDSTKTWRVYPGYYPGGINLQGGNFLMEPGVYYIGGGGFRVANAALYSVDPGEDQDDGVGGGVLIFNSDYPGGSPAPDNVVLQGGSAEVALWPLVGTGDYADYDKMVIYQDRDVTLDVEIHGGSSNMDVRGIIYAPTAHVFAEGSSGTLTMDQVIASTFRVKGETGSTINIAYDSDFLPGYRVAGLVE
jgi:hypothetical protein